MKSKERIGSRVKKKYESPQTPYQRVLDSEYVDEGCKDKLRQQYLGLNPVTLKRRITKVQKQLFSLAQKSPKPSLTAKRQKPKSWQIKPNPPL